MNACVKVSRIVLGVVSVGCAGLGLHYNAGSMFTNLSGAFQKMIDEYKLPYFYQSFYVMSAVCIAFYLILLFCGIEFLRSRFRFVWLFVYVLVFEVVYFFMTAFYWLIPGLGRNVAAADGVANGGQMFQFLILLPLWAPFLAVWTKRQYERPPQPPDEGPVNSPPAG